MAERRRKRLPYRVGMLAYVCRPLHPDDEQEEGDVEGFFTGEIDTWGKYTFVPLCGLNMYLFADEIVAWVPHGA